MLKQILRKIPRKSSKSGRRENGGHGNHVTYFSVSGESRYNGQPGISKSGNPSVQAADSSENGASLKPNKTSAHPSYEALPAFKDVHGSEKQNLFIRKLKLCCVVFDFSDPAKDLKEKEIKKQALLELTDYVASGNGKFTENVILDVVMMVSANLFRSFTPQRRENKLVDGLDLEEEEPSMDLAWPHLQLVYEFLLRFVASAEMDAKVAKRFIDQPFILKLIDLFDSEDPREREHLKTILHRIYGKFMVHRSFIRNSINNIFFRLIYETEKHNGITELLEILGSIINGFALPLKEEHKFFLVHALIPLHKPKCLGMYHQQLTYCITQFVEKDCKLSDTVIRGLLKYWPRTNSSKEVMFLNELEEVLEATQPQEFQRCMVPLFHQIARCLNSLHFQVAERALFLWNNNHIESLIKQSREVILPIIFPALEKNARNHWNHAVHSLTLNIRKIFLDLDPELFNECLLKFQEEESKQNEVEARRAAKWKFLEEIADKRSTSTSTSTSCSGQR